MSQIKQFKEFSTENKLRDLILQEINPIILRLQNQWKKVRGQMDECKEVSEIMMKFNNQKDIIQKNIKEMRKELTDCRTSLAVSKSEVEINHTKNNANYVTLKEEFMAFQRTLIRRDQTLTNYDRKINSLNQGLAKNQHYVNERLGIFEQKYKKLSKQTLEMTKDVKKEFQHSITNNQVLKSELLHKIRTVQDKQHIMDLYITERQQITSKFTHLFQKIHHLVKHNEFEEYKKIHHHYLLDYERKIQTQIQNILPPNAKLQFAQLNIKFAQIENLKQQTYQLEEIKKQIATIYQKIKGIQEIGDEKILKMRLETQQMQDKIIEVIDKKIEAFQQIFQQQLHIQNFETLQDKLKSFKQNLESEVYSKISEEISRLQSKKQVKIINSNPEQLKMISYELSIAREQRKKIESYCSDIKAIANGLEDKLNLFGHRITVCKSNIELFTQSTMKQLKNINILKQQQQSQNQQLGKILSDYLQTLLIIVSIQLQQEKNLIKQMYVTFKDGIVYQSAQASQSMISYRRNIFKVKQLKQSLLYQLLNLTDDLILNHSFLKIDINKPSDFFQSLKSKFQKRQKVVNRTSSLLIQSPRKTNYNQEEQQANILDFRRQSQQLFSRCQTINKTKITVTNGNIPWPFERNSSPLQRRYKGRRNQQRIKKQTEERNCITASRSHRKTKIFLI